LTPPYDFNIDYSLDFDFDHYTHTPEQKLPAATTESSNGSEESQAKPGSKHTSRRRRSSRKEFEHSPSLSPPPTSPTKSKKAKHTHNLIEKKYRNALNEKFASLRRHLPTKEGESGGLGSYSKGEVLLRARQYIRSLEEETRDLEEERRSLKCDIKTMEMLWTNPEYRS